MLCGAVPAGRPARSVERVDTRGSRMGTIGAVTLPNRSTRGDPP
ncbi:hypothetical protein KCH_76050 [Kitasatospora cheerisanensis KCTC 2395]|uniref:Uncharacterized protein n=1 Tax=Kitasatospora cheerisanensis KCTC 2395 TaxID=1348663 RepID=A0A066YL22_9ACTN|nr:hypothetical protein KCH_76050 [Kitasatospora cheerisanensis KCTC 2395]